MPWAAQWAGGLPWVTATPRATGPSGGEGKPGSHQGAWSTPHGSSNGHHVPSTYSVTGTSLRAFMHYFAEPPRLGRRALCCPYHPDVQASEGRAGFSTRTMRIWSPGLPTGCSPRDRGGARLLVQLFPAPPPREGGNYDAASTMVDLKSSRPQTSFAWRAEVSLPHASTCRRGRREEGPSPKARPPSLALWRLSGQNPSACTRPHWGPGWLLVGG